MSADVTVTKSDVGLSAVTNDAQTKATVVPNTTPSAGQLLVGNAGGTSYAPVSASGDATVSSTGAISVTKSGGVAFGSAAFTASTAYDTAGAAAALTPVLYNTASTGVYSFAGITVNSGDPTHKIDIPAAYGWVINNTGAYSGAPIITPVTHIAETAVALTYLASADATYILINSSGASYQQTTHPTPQNRRDNILVAKVVHPNRSTIQSVANYTDYSTSPMSALREMFTPFPLINDGVVAYANGANLNFNTTAGNLYGLGINWTVDQKTPNAVSVSAAIPRSFFYRTQTGGTTGSVSLIDPTRYDVGGTITSIGGGGNQATNQRIYIYPTGIVNVQYGQTLYSSLANAIAGQQTEMFVKATNAVGSAVLVGIIAVIKSATALNDTSKAIFTPASILGESVGGVNGISTTTLQQAYNNSVTPEIVTNSTLGALSLQRGSGADTDAVLEILNGASGITASVTGAGAATFTTVNSGTLSGNNSGNQTISITGDVTAAGSTGALSSTVTKINGTALSGLTTGILKNTTSTGVPSIAVAADLRSIGGQIHTESSTAPSSPAAGDTWFNKVTGQLFEYYTDVDSSQWVEIASNATPVTSTTFSSGAIIKWDTSALLTRGNLGISAVNTPVTPTGGISATDVQNALAGLDTAKANLASPTFSGTPSLPTGTTATTQSVGDSSTKLATTAFVANTVAAYAVAYVAKTGAYNIATTDYVVECTSGTFTVTLPTAAGVAGKQYTINNSGTGVITIATTSSQLINANLSGTLLLSQWNSLSVTSNGTNWIIT